MQIHVVCSNFIHIKYTENNIFHQRVNGPRGATHSRRSETQTSLLSYRDWLENLSFACSKFRYHNF